LGGTVKLFPYITINEELSTKFRSTWDRLTIGRASISPSASDEFPLLLEILHIDASVRFTSIDLLELPRIPHEPQSLQLISSDEFRLILMCNLTTSDCSSRKEA
jgi:hypothetical protein